MRTVSIDPDISRPWIPGGQGGLLLGLSWFVYPAVCFISLGINLSESWFM